MSYEAMGYSRKGNKRGGGISHKITYVNVNRFKFVKVEIRMKLDQFKKSYWKFARLAENVHVKICEKCLTKHEWQK